MFDLGKGSIFLFSFINKAHQTFHRNSSRANQPFPCLPPTFLPLLSAVLLPTLPVADAGSWLGLSGKAWPPNSAVSKGTVERPEDDPVEGGLGKSAFLRPRPPPCFSFLSGKGEVGPGPQREKFWGAWKDFSSSHSLWQQDGPWRWIFVALS